MCTFWTKNAAHLNRKHSLVFSVVKKKCDKSERKLNPAILTLKVVWVLPPNCRRGQWSRWPAPRLPPARTWPHGSNPPPLWWHHHMGIPWSLARWGSGWTQLHSLHRGTYHQWFITFVEITFIIKPNVITKWQPLWPRENAMYSPVTLPNWSRMCRKNLPQQSVRS